MDVTLFSTTAATVTCFICLIVVVLITRRSGSRVCHVPPTPGPALPILGHLHLLKPPLHRTFHRFASSHGPIFSLKLGVRRVVVVSSPDLLEECSTKNDVVLSNRPHVLADKYIGYNHTTMAGERYGHRWRSLRRLSAQEVLSPARLNASSQIRHDEVRRTLKTLTCTQKNAKLVLRPILFELIFNTIMRMLAGKRCSQDDDACGERFREMAAEFFEHAQTSNPEDFLPFLLWIDYRGFKKQMAALGQKLDNFYQNLLEEHRRNDKDTIIGHLLSLQKAEPEFYTDETIKGFITNTILAGTDTTSVAIEWAMSLLLNHPDILNKAKQELDSQVGHHRLINEQDLPNLHYFQSIILESLRMFPPGPLGLPREASADCRIGGYDIPCGTIVLFNLWAIHRDPKVWDEPTRFKPERFAGNSKEVELQKLMAFGVGRRACPGSGLGQRMVGLALGGLIQCFEWERVGSEEVDLDEGVGLTMPKLNPLVGVCKTREDMIKVLHDLETN